MLDYRFSSSPRCNGLFFFFLLFCNSIALAFPKNAPQHVEKSETGIALAPSHIVIVQADSDFVYGAYYFAVSNKSDAEQTFATRLRLPRESVDFQVAEALSNDDVTVGQDGVLNIKKSFGPGLTLVGLQFKVPVHKSSANHLTFVPAENIQALYIATPQNSLLHFKAEGFVEGIPPMLAGGNYTGIRGQSISPGQVVVVSVEGFPGGRLPFLILGGIMALVLLVSAVILALKTSKEKTIIARGLYD